MSRTLPTSPSNTPTHAPGDELTRGSLWGVATLAVSAGGGFLFWIVAAITSTDDADVGRAAAWFSLLQLVVMACAVGSPVLVNRRGGDADASEVAGSSLVTVALAAIALGALAPLVAGDGWRMLSDLDGVVLAPAAALLAVGAAATLVVDARLMSVRSWRGVFLRGAFPAVARVPLLLIDPIADRATWIILLAMAPIALSGYLGWWLLRRRGLIRLAMPSTLGTRDRRFLAGQHLAGVATQAPYHLIPLMVAGRVAGETNAAFYLVWGIGVMITMFPHTLAQVLLSEASLEQQDRLSRIRRTLLANVGVGLLAWLGAIVLGRPVLGLLGDAYAEVAEVLPWLVLAAIVFGVTVVGVTEARLARDSALTNLITWTIALGSVGAGLVMIPGRPVWGAVFAWVGANVVAMIVAVVGVERRVLDREMPPASAR